MDKLYPITDNMLPIPQREQYLRGYNTALDEVYRRLHAFKASGMNPDIRTLRYVDELLSDMRHPNNENSI